MRKLIWFVGWMGVAVWSLAMWVGHGLVGLVAGFAGSAAGRVDGFPVDFFSIPGLVEATANLGAAALVVVWVIGAAAILAVPYFLTRVFFPGRKPRALGPTWVDRHLEKSGAPRPAAPAPDPFPTAARPFEPTGLVGRMLGRKR